MTLTMQIIKILSDGEPRGTAELVRLTGKSKEQVLMALAQLQRKGYGAREPARYALTE